jgi:hypothetical protein
MIPSQSNQLLGGGLESSLYALSKHPTIVESIALLINFSFKGNFRDRFIEEIKANHSKNEG